MTEMIIENGIVIDDVESVLCGIRELCGQKITDLEVVKKFINHEKNTKFYLDNNLNSYMQQEPSCIYIWLDTGYQDSHGNPILISVLKGFDGFIGHVVGTVYTLAENVRSFFRLNRNMVEKKVTAFRKKYASKSDSRDTKHIADENAYFLNCCSDNGEISSLGMKLLELGYELPNPVEEIIEEIEETAEEPSSDFSVVEEEITIGLLLEKMDGMQAYMDELVEMIETMSSENQAQIQELQEKNDEYKRVILQMRNFVQQENEIVESKETESMPGHDLIGNHSKILVIGGEELGINVMQGIAKGYGFDKRDFEFVTYDKAKGFTDRIRRDGKYCAVIFGACPHKTSGNNGYTSTLEKLRQTEGMPFTADARSKSGKLKVTKESFRDALCGVCDNLRMAYAC